MLAEAFPRLAVRLHSTFPDATVSLAEKAQAINVSFTSFPDWEVHVKALDTYDEQFQVFESSITLRYECLQTVSADDFHRFLAAENLGLRGASILAQNFAGKRILRIRSTFLGQKGRTRDEAENLAIDTLSLFRFARMLEDRVLRSTVGEHFSYEMYYSQYLSKSIGRNRYINYARSVFQGSTDRVLGQVLKMMQEDYKYGVELKRGSVATIRPKESHLEITVRVPDEVPMLTCTAPLFLCPWEPSESFALVAKLNNEVSMGHFEVNPDGTLISFVAWKHLTNDLRFYSLDKMILAMHEAERVLKSHINGVAPASPEVLKERASSLGAYRAAA